YEFKVFDTPEALHAAIAARNQDNKARVVAGYCWPWRSKKDPRQQNIVIGDYQRQWNLDQDGSLWIIAENSIEQVGCIHTCQGLEVDYIGVIIGPDLIVRDGKI
ncbi:DNA/RNA helicase domain-containing protein, partial [Pseudomonas aeruginosa]|uniref:DNA/RNA helicase domain-containing protein n=1 Tax=Pseudomonas aeruginosa TaxID=287 RepID=UPI003CF252D7